MFIVCIKVEKTAQQLSIHMISVNGVKGNAKLRIRNTYTGVCDTIPYHPYFNKLQNETGYTRNCALATVQLVR